MSNISRSNHWPPVPWGASTVKIKSNSMQKIVLLLLFVCLGSYICDFEGLLLALHPRITRGDAMRTVWDAKDRTGVTVCKANAILSFIPLCRKILYRNNTLRGFHVWLFFVISWVFLTIFFHIWLRNFKKKTTTDILKWHQFYIKRNWGGGRCQTWKAEMLRVLFLIMKFP